LIAILMKPRRCPKNDLAITLQWIRSLNYGNLLSFCYSSVSQTHQHDASSTRKLITWEFLQIRPLTSLQLFIRPKPHKTKQFTQPIKRISEKESIKETISEIHKLGATVGNPIKRPTLVFHGKSPGPASQSTA
jgi:hypothetical protein